ERRGRKLALPGGPEPTADDKPGVLDADDLLVFMACDAGEQASPAALARALAEAGADAVWRELRIEDPVEHTRGFVYLVSVAHPYFYPQHVYGPGSLKLPFLPGILFRDISAYGGVDGRDLRGWRYFAPGTPPDGFAVDGHMDERERAFASSGEWFVLAHGSE